VLAVALQHALQGVLSNSRVHPCQNRVQAQWATPDLVIAQRRLLRAALQEPRNARFLMASDSCVPLYPPATVHAALLGGEPRSRIAACRPTWEDNFPLRADPESEDGIVCDGGMWFLQLLSDGPCNFMSAIHARVTACQPRPAGHDATGC